MFEKPINLFEAQIRDAFKPRDEKEVDYILTMVSLVLYSDPNNSDIYDLYKTLSLEDFVRVIHVFNGRTVKLPSSVEIREAIILAICYYYKNVKGMSWKEIKNVLPFDISSISYGVRLKSLNSFIRGQMNSIIEQMMKAEAKTEPKQEPA